MTDYETVPPSNVPAEQCLIASMMLDKSVIPAVKRLVDRESFYQPDHQPIFDVLVRLHDQGQPVDSIIVSAELERRNLLAEVGGRAYIGEILAMVPSAAHAEQYATTVRDLHQFRQIIGLSTALNLQCYAPKPEDASGLIETAIEKLWKIAVKGRPVEIIKLSDAADAFIESRASGASASAVDSGFTAIDEDFAGIYSRGGYTLVAGRPSMGKSTFIRDQLTRWARASESVGLISIEETLPKIAGNALAARTGLENSYVASGRLADADVEKLKDAANELRDYAFYVIDSASSIGDVIMSMEILATQYGCTHIAIDHVHLIDSPEHAENRNQQLGEISKRIKNTIKRLSIVGVVAAQLSRPPKLSVPPPPVLSDLRDSGSLDEHADAVLMLHRQDYYRRDEDGYSPDGLCDVLIRKNRNGCVGAVSLHADLSHQRFIETQPAIPDYL